MQVLRLRRSWVLLLSSCSALGRCLLHLFLGFLLCLFLRLLRASAACPATGYLWRLLYISGSSCLSCSCGGAMSVGFEVSFVQSLVLPCAVFFIQLLRFALLLLPPVTLGSFYPFWPRLPVLQLRWWCELGCHPSLVFSGLHPLRPSCRCSLGSAPCVRVLPLWLFLLVFRLCGGALWLPVPLGLCWLFCHLLQRFSASVGGCAMFTACFHLLKGECASSLRCLRCMLAVRLVQ